MIIFDIFEYLATWFHSVDLLNRRKDFPWEQRETIDQETIVIGRHALNLSVISNESCTPRTIDFVSIDRRWMEINIIWNTRKEFFSDLCVPFERVLHHWWLRFSRHNHSIGCVGASYFMENIGDLTQASILLISTKIDIRWVLFEPSSTKMKNSPLLFANTAFHELRKIRSSLLTRVDLQKMIHRMKMFFFFFFKILSSLLILAMDKKADTAYAYLFKYIIIGDTGSLIDSSSSSTRIQAFHCSFRCW